MGKNGKVELKRDGTRFKMAQNEKEEEKRSNRIKNILNKAIVKVEKWGKNQH